jgi:hypothetical protein
MKLSLNIPYISGFAEILSSFYVTPGLLRTLHSTTTKDFKAPPPGCCPCKQTPSPAWPAESSRILPQFILIFTIESAKSVARAAQENDVGA